MSVRELQNGSFVDDDDPGEPGTEQKRVSVTASEGQLLGWLVANKRVLEIGTGLGVSTDFLCTHARRVATVDIDPWVWANVWPELKENWRNKVKCYAHRDHVEGMFDFAFIDGRHTEDETAADVAFAKDHIRRGLIVVHDARIEAVSDALVQDHNDWMVVPTQHGMALSFVGWDW